MPDGEALFACGRPLRGVAAWAGALLAAGVTSYLWWAGYAIALGGPDRTAHAVGIGISAIVLGFAAIGSAVLGPPMILVARRLRFPRPLFEIMSVVLCTSIASWLLNGQMLWPALNALAVPFGVVGGGGYWLLAGRPKPREKTDYSP